MQADGRLPVEQRRNYRHAVDALLRVAPGGPPDGPPPGGPFPPDSERGDVGPGM